MKVLKELFIEHEDALVEHTAVLIKTVSEIMIETRSEFDFPSMHERLHSMVHDFVVAVHTDCTQDAAEIFLITTEVFALVGDLTTIVAGNYGLEEGMAWGTFWDKFSAGCFDQELGTTTADLIGEEEAGQQIEAYIAKILGVPDPNVAQPTYGQYL